MDTGSYMANQMGNLIEAGLHLQEQFYDGLFPVDRKPSGAFFSDCRKYRYALWRIWDESKPLVMFIGLNPSTANETETDNTITRIKGIVKNWGYGGFYMTNLFAYVSTDPNKLLLPEATDSLNDHCLGIVSSKCEKIVFAWGAFKQAGLRSKEVIAMFPNAYALKLTKDGSPWHPLYVKSNITPVHFNQPPKHNTP